MRTLDKKLIGSVNKAGARRPRILRTGGTGFRGTGIGSAEGPAAADVSEAEAASAASAASAAAEPRSLSGGSGGLLESKATSSGMVVAGAGVVSESIDSGGEGREAQTVGGSESLTKPWESRAFFTGGDG